MTRTSTTTIIIGAALAGLFAAAAPAAPSKTAEPAKEKCAGIVKASLNDCATSTNACHGHVTTDSNSEAWIYLPAGTCSRIVGAHLSGAIDPTPPNQ